MFIERAKQLLKPGGWAGVILPSSILSNAGIYTNVREIILKYFNIKAIAEFGSNTFMATGTNTVTLFLERKPNNEWKKIDQAIKNFFDKPKDATVNGIEKAFGKYVAEVFEGLELADYVSLVNKEPNELVKKEELFADYKTWFNKLTEIRNLKKKKSFKDKPTAEQQTELDKLFYEKVFALEKDKMLYFFLTYPQQIVLIKVGKKQAEKDFIGYEFSNRRGHEGIKMYRDENGSLATKLYDDHNHLNPKKASYYVYQAFLQKQKEIEQSLKKNIAVFNLLEPMNFKKRVFEKSISLGISKKIELKSKYELVRLEEKITLVSGQSPKSTFYNNKGEGLPFYQGKTEFGDVFLNDPVVWTKEITKESIKDDILMSVRAPVGPVNINPFEKICIGRGLSALRVGKDILNYYLFYLLKYNQAIISGNDGAIFQSISRYQIEAIKIPVPPKSIQEKIIAEITTIEQKEKAGKEKVENISQKLNSMLKSVKGRVEKCRFSDIATLEYGKPLPKKARKLGDYLVMGSNGSIGTHNKFLVKGPCIIVGRKGSAGKVNFVQQNCYPIDTTFYVKFSKSKILIKYLYYLLKELNLEDIAKGKGIGVPGLNRNNVHELRVVIHPMAEQTDIVSEIEELEKEIITIEANLANVNNEKEQILRKYLE